MKESSPPTREELEARWQTIWAQGEELKERKARLLESLATVQDGLGRRALDQLATDLAQHEEDLRELRRAMDENGGFHE